jgi:hypothetical protein
MGWSWEISQKKCSRKSSMAKIVEHFGISTTSSAITTAMFNPQYKVNRGYNNF